MIELLVALLVFAVWAWRAWPANPFDEGERRHG